MNVAPAPDFHSIAVQLADAQTKADRAKSTVDLQAAALIKQLKPVALEHMQRTNTWVYDVSPTGPFIERVVSKPDADLNNDAVLESVLQKMLGDVDFMMNKFNAARDTPERVKTMSVYMLACAAGNGKETETVRVVPNKPVVSKLSALFGLNV